jgi:hypothetical protein
VTSCKRRLNLRFLDTLSRLKPCADLQVRNYVSTYVEKRRCCSDREITATSLFSLQRSIMRTYQRHGLPSDGRNRLRLLKLHQWKLRGRLTSVRLAETYLKASAEVFFPYSFDFSAATHTYHPLRRIHPVHLWPKSRVCNSRYIYKIRSFWRVQIFSLLCFYLSLFLFFVLLVLSRVNDEVCCENKQTRSVLEYTLKALR